MTFVELDCTQRENTGHFQDVTSLTEVREFVEKAAGQEVIVENVQTKNDFRSRHVPVLLKVSPCI